MPAVTLTSVSKTVRAAVYPITGDLDDYTPLLELIGNARLVLLGEASHGTHEFYRERAQITKRLIKEKGFTAVAVEADWPDAYRVNRFVRGAGEDASSIAALGAFKRFPAWMWRNAEVLDFVGWLRSHNDALSSASGQVGFYGLDLYSLHTSIEEVLNYLKKVDPAAATRARYGGVQLGGARSAQTCPSRPAGKLRSPIPRGRLGTVSLAAAAGKQGEVSLAGTEAGARYRRYL